MSSSEISSVAAIGTDHMTLTHCWKNDHVFNAAWAYDLAFAWDVSPELDIVLGLAGLDRASTGKLLVPACGTGRHALALAERGFQVEASDLNAAMLARAIELRGHPRIRYQLADMTQPMGDGTADCDAVFTFCNSFRYILDAAGVHGHLATVRTRLRPGGIYVLELALNQAAAAIGQRARWIVRHDWREVHACWTLRSLTPPTSLETAEIRVIDEDGTVHEFSADQPQRLWTRAALEEFATIAGLDVMAVVDTQGVAISQTEVPVRSYVALQRRAS